MLWDNYERTLAAVVDNVCSRSPEKEALIFNDQTLTWARLNDYASKLASYLISAGISHGDRVGVMCTVRPEYVIAYLACAKIGAILVGFNVAYKADEVRKLVQRTQPKAFLLLRRDRERDLFTEISPVLAAQPGKPVLIPIEPEEQYATGALREIFDAELEPQELSAVHAAQESVTEDDGLLIVFTSGSTGVPKAAILTHQNIVRNIAVLIHNFQIVESDRVLVHLPLNHVGGANNQLAAMILAGATAVMLERFHPKTALQAIEKHQVSYMMQVPTMYIMMFGVENYTDYDLSSLRACCVAGAVTPPNVMRQMQQMAPLVVTGYGMTEVGGYATYTQADDDPDTIANTVGKIAPEYRLRIVGENKNELETGEVGEIALAGDCVFKGYFGDPAATQEAVIDGWYYTGDLGYLDERGYVTLVDRKKNMFITGGFNVYPREIEDAVAAMPDVDMCACVSRKDPTFGEVGVLFVVLKKSRILSAEAIVAYCRETLADYKVPRYISIGHNMPLTALGKIDKQALISRALELEDELIRV